MRRRRHKRSTFDSDCASDCPNHPAATLDVFAGNAPAAPSTAQILDLQTISQPSLKEEMNDSLPF